MRFSETNIVGARVIDPEPRKDNRGRFMQAWWVWVRCTPLSRQFERNFKIGCYEYESKYTVAGV
jgi:hypothetical protein